jgi:SAM-dependent methyltransferase
LDNTGCGCDCGTETDNFATFGLDYSKMDGYLKDADYTLGCGIPTKFAEIIEGDTVLDLGSGAGNDVFVARKMVGKNGTVIGVDMTEAMIKKANENKTKLGVKNIEFRLGEIENLPVENNSINVVISNCVINLVPNKEKAFSEVYRVLKDDGKFVISDIVTIGKLPKSIQKSMELYVGCISGAISKDVYIDVVRNEGFHDVSILEEKEYPLSDSFLLENLSQEKLEEFKENGAKILSITVKGVK